MLCSQHSRKLVATRHSSRCAKNYAGFREYKRLCSLRDSMDICAIINVKALAGCFFSNVTPSGDAWLTTWE